MTKRSPGPLRLTVAIATYQRPEQLEIGLPRVLEQVRALTASSTPLTADLLIIDNDAAGSAADGMRRIADEDVRYVVEPTPGIVAARNRALDECAANDLLVFIDDDETPRPSWLAELVSTYLLTRPAGVQGRVVSQYDRSRVAAWVAAVDLFERPCWPTGTEVRVAASNNLLLDLKQLRALGLRFDHRLGLAGGEDSLLTRLLTDRGGRIVFCAESVVDDCVVEERLTRSWLLTRAVSQGGVRVLVDLLAAGSTTTRRLVRVRAMLEGVLRVLGGGLHITLGLLSRSLPRRVLGSRMLWRGVGMIRAAVGRHLEEYKRT